MATGAVLAVLFDLDGTLADTLGDIASSMNDALAAVGLPTHPPEAYRRFVGDGVLMLARRALGPGREVLAPDLVDAFRTLYAGRLVRATRPYPGIVPLLEDLRARELPLAVLSNKPHDATRAIVEALFGAETFTAVTGEQAGTPRKPDPTAALALARLLAVPPARCLLVGDSPVDIVTATRAGMVPVGVAWGFRSPDDLVEAGAEVVLAQPAELLRLLA